MAVPPPSDCGDPRSKAKAPERDEEYIEAIGAGLDDAFKDAGPPEELDPATDRIVVFSDHHKGRGDQADDFRHCEHAYTAALGWYLEQGYRLFILGDAEELWEESPGRVITRYGAVLRLEAQFRAPGRGGLERFYGNHDDTWAKPRPVEKHMTGAGKPFAGLRIRQSLRMTVRGHEGVELFFAHGHQGTPESDKLSAFARLPVRHIWRRIQRATGASATTPSTNYALRGKHNQAMAEWATKRGNVVLVAGHTHRPVFGNSVPDPAVRTLAEIEPLLRAAEEAGDRDAVAGLRAEREYACTQGRRPDEGATVAHPCYFNTGCCSFPDGDITGLEIADGEIRLVRWPADLRELGPVGAGVDAERRRLATMKLDAVLREVGAAGRADANLRVRELRPERG